MQKQKQKKKPKPKHKFKNQTKPLKQTKQPKQPKQTKQTKQPKKYPIIPRNKKFKTPFQRKNAYEKELKKGLSARKILIKLRKQGLKIRTQVFYDEIRPIRKNVVEYNRKLYTNTSVISAGQYEPREKEAQKKRYHAIFEIETYRPDETGRPIKNSIIKSFFQIGSNRLRSIEEWQQIIKNRFENFEVDYTRKIKSIRIHKLVKYVSKRRTKAKARTKAKTKARTKAKTKLKNKSKLKPKSK